MLCNTDETLLSRQSEPERESFLSQVLVSQLKMIQVRDPEPNRRRNRATLAPKVEDPAWTNE